MDQQENQQTQQAQQAQPQQQPTIIIQNTNTNTNVNAVPTGSRKNKWVTLLLWFFLGVVGGHKFYEGKVGMGILYIFTAGLFGIGLLVDFFAILFKPTHYYC
ncbi:MAG: TM2 domain-containing protein [Clostridia bacterium]|nr:TM2 domain-containing protein [Clostridia bacterium]